MDNGCIEIGNIMTQASPDVISKLRSILDQHGIFHIVDGVLFNPPNRNWASNKATLRDGINNVKHASNDLLPDGQFRIEIENYRELIVPDLYKLNFISIVHFDAEEADLFAELIYGVD